MGIFELQYKIVKTKKYFSFDKMYSVKIGKTVLNRLQSEQKVVILKRENHLDHEKRHIMKQDRRLAITEAVNKAGELNFQQLKELFSDVSDMTLRSDLRELDGERKLVRVHGGAKSIGNVVRTDDLFFRKAARNINEKKQIARKALQFLKPDMSIFLDCGTTMLELARILPDEKLFIVTNSVSCMPELARLVTV